jgi:hypothetical protein
MALRERNAAPPDYTRALSRPLPLADGRALVALHDAAALLAATSSTVRAWSELEAASDPMEFVMRARQLL